jgi:hypothetical protein
MGYPFDRKYGNASTLKQFADTFDNFAVRDVKIKFVDRYIDEA